ncbi:MAG: gamma-glutamyltransferase [Pirellulales bacterium]|nr:gamma-glutamyltransferase [Pirellulales bacterium]
MRRFLKSRLAILSACLAILFATIVLADATFAQPPQGQDDPTTASGMNGAVAAGARQAADAGLAMLQSGGNAADAAVTTMLVQNVLEAGSYCFGGEVPIIVYDKNRNVVEVIAGLGSAPLLATPEWFKENRNGVIQGRGDPANAVVPGALDAYIVALERYGTKSFTECAAPMMAILERRAAPPEQDPQQAGRNNQTGQRGGRNRQRRRESAQRFLRTMQRLCEAESRSGGDRLRGLRLVRDYFYRGPIARELDAWSRENGGLLRYQDMAKHYTRIDEPLAVNFRDHTVYKCNVWTQGPFMLQTLNMLDGFNLDSMGHNSADYVHTVTEAMKLCFADRDAFFGDPDFVVTPIETLLSAEYLELRRPLLDMQTASLEQRPGDPYKMKAELGIPPRDHDVVSGVSNDTTSCLVADKFGNVISATPSGWGGVEAGETGIQLGSRMIGLTAWDNHPSELAPTKRPRITLTPTLVFKNDRPVFAISVAGGDQQDQTSLQILLNRLVFGMDPFAAVKAPRFGTDHHINWFGHLPVKPGSLTLSRRVDQSIFDDLTARGHKIRARRPSSSPVVLAIDPETNEKHAGGDRGRNAAAY